MVVGSCESCRSVENGDCNYRLPKPTIEAESGIDSTGAYAYPALRMPDKLQNEAGGENTRFDLEPPGIWFVLLRNGER